MATEDQDGTALVLVDRASRKRSKKERKKAQHVDEAMNPGVVYVGHIPHGFYEDEMKGFFSQFGEVRRVKVSRNKKTGRCKGHAFVEFACDEVAKIVAGTMNNYLMFNKLLKCQYIDSSHVHAGMMGGRRRLKELRASIRLKKAQRRHNKPRTTVEHNKRMGRLLLAERKKRNKLKSLGLEYDFPGYWQQAQTTGLDKRSSHTVFVDSDGEGAV